MAKKKPKKKTATKRAAVPDLSVTDVKQGPEDICVGGETFTRASFIANAAVAFMAASPTYGNTAARASSALTEAEVLWSFFCARLKDDSEQPETAEPGQPMPGERRDDVTGLTA